MTIFAYSACVLIWGTTWYAIELQLGQVSPDWSVAYRFFFSALVLFAYCGLRKQKLKYSLKQHGWMMWLGILLFSTNYIFVYWGTGYITSGLVAVSFSLMTFFNILFGRIFLKNPIEAAVMGGALIGIVGLVFIFWPEVEVLSFADQTTVGILLCLTGTIFASLGNTVAAARTTRSVPLFPLTAWAMFYGSIATALVALASGHMPSFDDRATYWYSFLYLSIFGSVIAFTLYLWLLEHIGVARASYNTVLTPIVALAVSTVMEQYQWSTASMIGVGLVLGGNLLLIQRKTKLEDQTQ